MRSRSLVVDRLLSFACLSAILVSLSACSQEAPVETEEEPGTALSALADTAVSPSANMPSTDLGTTDLAPVIEEPIETKISRVIEQAKQTKSEYSAFRERMFDEAFAQIKTVLCSSYRLQLLKGRPREFYKGDPDLYMGRIDDVLKRQGNQPFIQLTRQRQKQPVYGNQSIEEVFVSIPKSEAYSKRELALVSLTYTTNKIPIYDGLTTDWQEQEALYRWSWKFDPLAACEQSYKEPVPNSMIARDESSESMGALIASSLQNLRGYSAKLETVEREWTRANDLELLLLSLQQSLDFNEIDPTARNNVRSYEQELSEALADLGRAKTEGRIQAATVNRDEVREILRLFK